MRSLAAPAVAAARAPEQAGGKLRPPAGRHRGAIVAFALVLGAVAISVLPYLWMVSSSLRTMDNMFSVPIQWIPNPVNWRSYVLAWHAQDFTRYFLNSGVVAVAITLGNLLLCSLAGYSLAKFRYFGRGLLFILILSTMMLPLEVTMVPLFLIIKRLDWVNSYQGLIVPFLVDGFGVFLMRQYMLGIPKDLIDSARIDGASEFRIFWQIVLPLCKPALVALGVFTFREAWDMYIWPLIIVSKDSLRTLPLGDLAVHEQLWHGVGSTDGDRGAGHAADDRAVLRAAARLHPGHRGDRAEGVSSMSDMMRAVVIARYGGEAGSRCVGRCRGPASARCWCRCTPAGCAAPTCICCRAASRLANCRGSSATNSPARSSSSGDGVTQWRLGDRVTAAIDITCGHCRHCLTGETQRCVAMRRIGFEQDGGHADYVAVPAANLVEVPAEISYAAAAILPDAVACMYHSLVHQGRVGDRAARADPRRRRARHPRRADRPQRRCRGPGDQPPVGAAGARRGIRRGRGQYQRPVAGRPRWRRSRRAKASIWWSTTSARATASREGLSVLRPGGKLLLVGYLDETLEIPSMRFFKTEQEIIGCRGSTKQDLIDVVRLVQAGRITPVIGAHYKLEQIDEAAARLASGDLVGRIVLTR